MGELAESLEIDRQVREWARRYAGKRLVVFGAGAVGAAILRTLCACECSVWE